LDERTIVTLAGFITRVAAIILGVAGLVSHSHAQSTGTAPAKPILTISGKIGSSGEGAEQFDRERLEALGTVAVETKTPWYSGTVRFEGVQLSKLMAHVRASGQRVVALALNDYSTEIPIEDFEKYNVILALKRDGEYMPIRDKGPLFIVYPYDSDPELRSQKYYSRSAWQVTRMIVK
jgi:hypothetical protein